MAADLLDLNGGTGSGGSQRDPQDSEAFALGAGRIRVLKNNLVKILGMLWSGAVGANDDITGLNATGPSFQTNVLPGTAIQNFSILGAAAAGTPPASGQIAGQTITAANIATASIGFLQLAATLLAGSGALTATTSGGGLTSGVSVNVDGSTVSINGSNQLQAINQLQMISGNTSATSLTISGWAPVLLLFTRNVNGLPALWFSIGTPGASNSFCPVVYYNGSVVLTSAPAGLTWNSPTLAISSSTGGTLAIAAAAYNYVIIGK